MNSYQNILSNIANHATSIALPSIVAAVAKYKGIKDARQLDKGPLKNMIKSDFSIVSGVVNTVEIANFSLPCLLALYQNWRDLTTKQKTLVTGVFILATASSIYSFAQFGHEQTSMTTGGVATASCALFFTANQLAEKYSAENKVISDLEQALNTPRF